jgi:hypothetical protein
MKLGAGIVSGFPLLAPQLSRADFQYTESIKITGGALSGLLKFASRFGGTGSLPDSSTYYIQGNRMRVEEGDAKIEIIDLDTRHIVRMDAKKHTCVVLTFEEMRAQLDKFRQGQTHGSSGELQPPARIKVKATQNVRIGPCGERKPISVHVANQPEVKVKTWQLAKGKAEAAGSNTTQQDFYKPNRFTKSERGERK